MTATFDWKKIVGGIAPTIGTMLGGPMAGMAIKVLSEQLLGKPDASEAEVAAVFQNGQLNGEQIVQLRLADQAMAIKLKELDIDILRINEQAEVARLGDVADARKRQTDNKDNMPNILFFLLFAAYVGQYALFYFGPIVTDEFVKTLIIKAFGVTEVALITAIGFFIGTSKGSKRSGDTVREMALGQQKTISETAAKV